MLKDFCGRGGGAGVDYAVRRDDRGLGAAHPPALRSSGGGWRAGEKPDGGAEVRRSAWTLARPRHHHWDASCVAEGAPCARDRARSIAPIHDAKSQKRQKSQKRHVQRRIRPSPRSFGLFAAEGLDQDRQARRTGQSRPPAGAGADRHRQHVRGAGILRQDGGLRHPADRRLRTRGRFRRPGPQRAQCAGRGARAHRAAGGARARLSQPDAAELAGVPGNAGASVPAHQARMARGRCRGPDRADRRPGRADLAGAAGRSCRARGVRAATGWRACSATASMSNCSATASTASAASKAA